MRFLIVLLLLLCFAACNKEEAQNAFGAATDSTYLGGISLHEVQWVRTAGVQLEVDDVRKAADSVSSLVQDFGGFVYSLNLKNKKIQERHLDQSPDSVLVISAISPKATLQVRVPMLLLDSFITALQLPATTVAHLQLHTEDKTLEYQAQEMKEDNRKKVLRRMPEKINSGIAAEKTIAIGDEAIEQWQAQQQVKFDVLYSQVDIELIQNILVRREIVANPDLDVYRLPLANRFKNASANGVFVIIDFLIGLVYLWPFLLLIFVASMVYRFYNKKSAIKALLKQ